jgi:hypothetical protein
MKFLKNYLLNLFILAVLFGCAACLLMPGQQLTKNSRSAAVKTDSAAVKAETTNEPVAENTQAAAENSAIRKIEFQDAEMQLQDLKSYRVHYLYRDSDKDLTGEPREDFIEHRREINNQTGDRHLVLNQKGGIGVGIFNSYRIGGQFYASLEGSKSGDFSLMGLPVEARVPFKPIDVCRATGFKTARLIAKGVKIGSILADHYRWETPAPPSRWDLQTLKGDVWVAAANDDASGGGGYVVKYLIEGTDTVTGAKRWEYTVEAVNSIGEIKLP